MPAIAPPLLAEVTRRPTEASIPPWLYSRLVPSLHMPLPPLLAAAISCPASLVQTAASATAMTHALDDMRALLPNLDSLVEEAPHCPQEYAPLLMAAFAPIAVRLFRPLLLEAIWLWRQNRAILGAPTKDQLEVLVRPHNLPGVTSTARLERITAPPRDVRDPHDAPPDEKRRRM